MSESTHCMWERVTRNHLKRNKGQERGKKKRAKETSREAVLVSVLEVVLLTCSSLLLALC